MGHLPLAERGHRNCFHEAAAPEPGGDEALRRYDDNGKGRIRGAEARGHGMGPVERGHWACDYMRDVEGDGVACKG